MGVQVLVPTQEPVCAGHTINNPDLGASDIDRRSIPTPDTTHVVEASTKRKRPDGEKPSKDSATVSNDEEPPFKKHKTRSSAPVEFVELGSEDDEDVVVVPQRKRKSAATIKARDYKTAIEESKPTARSQVSELDKLLKQDEKRKSLAARSSVFARNLKLKRSFNDTVTASRMSRPRPVLQTVTYAAPRQTIQVTRPPIAKDSSSAEHAADAFAVDEEDPNVTHANLRTIKYINVTANIRNVHIDRIVEAPFQYPNVVIDFDDKNRPTKAHITKMTEDEYKVACEASLGREKEKRKLDAKLARKTKFGPSERSLRKAKCGRIGRQSRTSFARP
ncbi:hypothetical protein SLS60_000393 [Paraconiothyrium brasiliense]|uniref:Uncharacterized protein n=1 Tax=Paraconiothyrium brasiliense TaxID=300254 RepID=A0ABR3S642_9PLEO